MIILEIGCGKRKRFKNSIGLDKTIEGEKIVKWDLEDLPLPFKSNFFDMILAEHILEHINKDKFWKVMEELYRILKSNGRIKIVTPFYLHSESFVNPDHKGFFTTASFNFLNPDANENYYSKAKFVTIKKSFYARIFRHFTNLFLPKNMYVELEKV